MKELFNCFVKVGLCSLGCVYVSLSQLSVFSGPPCENKTVVFIFMNKL